MLSSATSSQPACTSVDLARMVIRSSHDIAASAGQVAAERPEAPPLPSAQTSLIGRARELAEIEALLTTARLLTLTGAGGSGKTRLALEVSVRAAARYDE